MSYRDGYDIRKWYAAGLKQRPRRYWVRWGLAGTTLVAFAAAALDRSDHPPFFLIALPGFAISFSPFARDSWATGRGLAGYDEFERTALLGATARAFATYIGLVTLLIGWLAVAPQLGWSIPVRPMQWMGWIIALLVIGLTLPSTFAEFMVPMPDPEDQTL